MRNRYIALIPAYEPERKLIGLTADLKEKGFDIVVVDDGSGPEYKDIFGELEQQATVLTHSQNRGKGAALKTGLRYINKYMPNIIHLLLLYDIYLFENEAKKNQKKYLRNIYYL